MTSTVTRLAAIAGVFMIAVAVRWPSCGESFWVDELHTAWCIEGTLGQVVERAAIGNQQPLYFAIVYLWQHGLPASLVAIYGIEPSLRVTSVLLTALSAAWLVAIVSDTGGWRLSKRGAPPGNAPSLRAPRDGRLPCHGAAMVGGVAAGLALALDRNAIFFGTELRPYAAIIFFSTAALALARRIIERGGGSDGPAGSDGPPIASDACSAPAVGVNDCVCRLALHGLVLAAAAIHITSLIVLAPQMLVFTISDVWRHRTATRSRFAILLTHGGAGVMWFAMAIPWSRSHAGLWQSRGNWDSFATAGRWSDIWQLWPWWALVGLPIAGWVIGYRLRGASLRKVIWRRDVMMASWILAGVIGSTLACYLISVYAGIPLWHRRYLIASLPLLCAAMGWLIGARDHCGRAAPDSVQITSTKREERTCLERFGSPGYRVGLALICLLALAHDQGTLTAWYRGDWRLARRGENWKAAVAFIRNTAVDGEQIWVDAGLIEQQGQPTLVTDPRMEAYLKYVTAGPYRSGSRVQSIGIGRGAIPAWLALGDHGTAGGGAAPRFLITRRRSPRMNSLPATIAAYRFGSVTVLRRQ